MNSSSGAGAGGALVCMLVLLLGRAEAETSPVAANETTIAWHVGSSGLFAAQRVIAGIGGGPRIHHSITHRLAIHGDAAWMFFAGNVVTLGAGATYAVRDGHWRPRFGGAVRMYLGDSVRVVNSDTPTANSGISWSVTAIARPFSFEGKGHMVSLLGIGIGLGLDGLSPGLGFEITVIEVGLTL